MKVFALRAVFVVLLALWGGREAGACRYLQSGQLVNTPLEKMTPTMVPICIILNDRSMFSGLVVFDVFSRVVLKGSFLAVVTPGACLTNRLWFPNMCTPNNGPGVGNGPPTNYYVSVQGVSSSYRKRYAQMDPDSSTGVSAVIPITTLVVSVDNGVVKSVYWSDGCFFSKTRLPGVDCAFNAYDYEFLLPEQQYAGFLNPDPNAKTSVGYDTLMSPSDCLALGQPSGFCDLGVYVVWTGTSADGKQLVSANPRFSRFRNSFAMGDQLPTMVNFNGHSFDQINATTTRSPTMRPTQ